MIKMVLLLAFFTLKLNSFARDFEQRITSSQSTLLQSKAKIMDWEKQQEDLVSQISLQENLLQEYHLNVSKLKNEIKANKIEISKIQGLSQQKVEAFWLNTKKKSKESASQMKQELSQQVKTIEALQTNTKKLEEYLFKANNYAQQAQESAAILQKKLKRIRENMQLVGELVLSKQEEINKIQELKQAQVASATKESSPQEESLEPIILTYPVEKFTQLKKSRGGFEFYGALEGSKVYPVREGRVIYIGPLAKYGQVVMVDHGKGMRSIYLGEFNPLVKSQEKISMDTLLGVLPKKQGKNKLYFELRQNENVINNYTWNKIL